MLSKTKFGKKSSRRSPRSEDRSDGDAIDDATEVGWEGVSDCVGT